MSVFNMKFRSRKVYALVVATVSIAVLFGGWVVIANAADFYVREIIRERHQYYTSMKYSDYVLMYVFLSAILLAGMLGIRFSLNLWRQALVAALCLVFGLFLALWIEDDIRFGRPIAPEIIFTSVILGLQLFVFHFSSKLIENLKREGLKDTFV